MKYTFNDIVFFRIDIDELFHGIYLPHRLYSLHNYADV